ncbi:MAG: hypothetical protein ABIB11_01855 [Candidatus Omnitrophota bacterium]
MKPRILRRKIKVKSVQLNKPKVEGNKIFYSWSHNPLLDEKGYWIEYKQLTKITSAGEEEILAPYLPICLAFAVLGDIEVVLPFKLDERIFNKWQEIINCTARDVYSRKTFFCLKNGDQPLGKSVWDGGKTGLFFGGGSESLLSLARLKEKGIDPILLSFEGELWHGSDHLINPHKFELEEGVASEFGLNIFLVSTSFFKLIYSPDEDWREYLGHNLWGIIMSALHVPFFLTAIMPVARQIGLKYLVVGNEEEDYYDVSLYCFCKGPLDRLKDLISPLDYKSYISDMSKRDVLEELHMKFTKLAKYQYSCQMNEKERWCLRCEKCFLNYIFFKLNNIDLTNVGIDEDEAKARLADMIHAAKRAVAEDAGKRREYNKYMTEALRKDNKEVCILLKSVFSNIHFRIFKHFLSLRKRIVITFFKNMFTDIRIFLSSRTN